ncbi:MAG TPA: response regulator [Pyrinomonadaceae bacterium]|nr:response regulator [Pyrinomonadaceae bacterium]
MTKPKLLLADDSVTIRKVVEMSFVDAGVDVFSTGDGEAAMQKFIEVQPDIVLVDVEMPGPNGYQICEMIKQDAATRHIPVLLLVGSFEPFDQTEAERVEADGFLTKPFQSIHDLVARVNDLLGLNSSSSAPTPETADIEELYQNSFAETVPIQDYDTEEDPFNGTYPTEEKEPANETEFDDAALDDEMIEALRPHANGDVEPIHLAETIQTTVKDFDWTPVAETSVAEVIQTPERVVDEEIEPVESGFEPRFAFAETEPVESESVEPVEPAVAAPINSGEEPSEDLIALIAQRVVEKLSDRVVREIAQEAVPRIAEKLIREALEEDKQQ